MPKIQEPYLNKEVYKEKKKSQTVYYHRCNKCKEHEESSAVPVSRTVIVRVTSYGSIGYLI